ncbi:MAG: hypothetical protein JO102_04235 [Elusimicrobia bacterium]|nr:hypothetical protein [Elusimicrobiota bacterium]
MVSRGVLRGIGVGAAIGIAQSTLTTIALRWSWNRSWFWWVWGGGVLFRLAVFVLTAFVIYRFTELSFVATLSTLVALTTVLLVVESATCLKG